ncbi:hypothetical protein [Tautonia rosea]|uniref:hypothetical protein n=1 Tax=Tautonia rosea TaxID=2728037 RepID=UPI001475BCF9|nr:hypothetical protein [Tautonia rosea]
MISRLNRRRGQRSGVASLIEVLAAMTVISVLFGTTASLTALMFRLERLGRDDLAATMTEGTLASDFRADVHAATRVEVEEDDPDQIVLIGPGDRKTTYRRQERSLIRKALWPDEPERRERYRLRPGTVVRWEREDSDVFPVISLVLEVPGTIEGDRRSVRIESTLGRDHRFEEDNS